MDIYARLKSFIKANNLSYNEFGRRIHTSGSQITNMITYKKRFGIDKLLDVLEAFPELNANWLLRGKGEMIDYQALSAMTLAAPLHGYEHSMMHQHHHIKLIHRTTLDAWAREKIQHLEHLEQKKFQLPENFEKKGTLIGVVGAQLSDIYPASEIILFKKINNGLNDQEINLACLLFLQDQGLRFGYIEKINGGEVQIHSFWPETTWEKFSTEHVKALYSFEGIVKQKELAPLPKIAPRHHSIPRYIN